MAHGEKTQSKAWHNVDYWSRRPMSGTPVSHRPGTNKRTKQITHKIERARAKSALRRDAATGI